MDRRHHWRIAAGSADEVYTTLQVAVAWGKLQQSEVDEALRLLDRVLAMTWRLTHWAQARRGRQGALRKTVYAPGCRRRHGAPAPSP
jgi:hypothetical protein